MLPSKKVFTYEIVGTVFIVFLGSARVCPNWLGLGEGIPPLPKSFKRNTKRDGGVGRELERSNSEATRDKFRGNPIDLPYLDQ